MPVEINKVWCTCGAKYSKQFVCFIIPPLQMCFVLQMQVSMFSRSIANHICISVKE